MSVDQTEQRVIITLRTQCLQVLGTLFVALFLAVGGAVITSYNGAQARLEGVERTLGTVVQKADLAAQKADLAVTKAERLQVDVTMIQRTLDRIVRLSVGGGG